MSKKNKARLPKYVCEDVDRYGKIRVYLRKAGQNKILLHGSPWSLDFMVEYGKALYGVATAGEAPIAVATAPDVGATAHKLRVEVGAADGTWKWLCQQYMAREEFKQLRGTTPKTRRRILESTWVEPLKPGSDKVYGGMPISKMTHLAVLVLRDRKAEFKTAANDRRKIMGYVFRWGMSRGLHPVLKTPSLVFLWNQEVGHGETEVHAGVQA